MIDRQIIDEAMVDLAPATGLEFRTFISETRGDVLIAELRWIYQGRYVSVCVYQEWVSNAEGGQFYLRLEVRSAVNNLENCELRIGSKNWIQRLFQKNWIQRLFQKSGLDIGFPALERRYALKGSPSGFFRRVLELIDTDPHTLLDRPEFLLISSNGSEWDCLELCGLARLAEEIAQEVCEVEEMIENILRFQMFSSFRITSSGNIFDTDQRYIILGG